ncbi:MAG: NADH-quinone oxidoreductase subunit H, partial [Firmicutes bacterium]|nr:NADH-quinone oxidoreductase subunit H [Bacillota bacterium]
ATVGIGVEPALMVIAAFLMAATGHTTPVSIASSLSNRPLGLAIAGVFAAGVAMSSLAELGRLPVDNVDTHLEVTMMHQATTLEYSGRLLAAVEFAQMVKFVVVLTLFWELIRPNFSSGILSFFVLIAALIGEAAGVGWIERRFAKLRFFQLPQYILSALGLGVLAIYWLLSGGIGR